MNKFNKIKEVSVSLRIYFYASLARVKIYFRLLLLYQNIDKTILKRIIKIIDKNILNEFIY